MSMAPTRAAAPRSGRRGALGIAVGVGVAVALAAAAPAHAQRTASERVRVTFVVEAPASTPKDAGLWISGNLPELGAWSGTGVALARDATGRWVGSVTVVSGAALEYKVTRGGWDTVEKGAVGEEIANRRWTSAADDTLRVQVAAWRDQTGEKPRASTRAGDIRTHGVFPSRWVKPRDVLVYLPPGYERDTTVRYPVFYFHDGNNVFDAATSFLGVEWGVDETAEKLIRSGAVRPFIAVAVYNTPDRVSEYTPAVDPQNGGGKAADYARFLIEELKPFIDRVYRTRSGPGQTGVVGSSLGGIVSLYLGLQYPNEFGLVGCLSPAAWWADRDIIRRAARATRGARIWVDIGTAETAGGTGPQRWIDEARELAAALRAAGYRDRRDLHYEEVAGAVHNEGAWAARIDRILTFLLGPPERSKRGTRTPRSPAPGRSSG